MNYLYRKNRNIIFVPVRHGASAVRDAAEYGQGNGEIRAGNAGRHVPDAVHRIADHHGHGYGH